jgi:chloramphenicol O-acetyltransferase
VTCNVDITLFRQFVKTRNRRFYISASYVIARAVNSVPELRHRLIGGELL